MGSSQSAAQVPSEDEHQDSDEGGGGEEEEEDEVGHDIIPNDRINNGALLKKILQQEPEMLPCHQSASPLSPQLSAFGTPRNGPTIKVWDPYNVLAPPPPPPPHIHSFSDRAGGEDDRSVTEVYLIAHGECRMNLRPDLIPGRCPGDALTSNGKRQARALAVFLKSQGVRFNAIYTSPMDRARDTAVSVCQELNFSEEHIQSSDSLAEMSQGHWEGCHKSDIMTPETLSLIERMNPDFSSPSGESLRQVEFRMVQFINTTVMSFPEKFHPDFSSPLDQNHNPHQMDERDGPSLAQPHWDLIHRQRQGLSRKKSGKSRLQVVTTTGDNEADDEMSPREPNKGLIRDLNNIRNGIPEKIVSNCIGLFSHSGPIRCLLTGLLGCSPAMSQKICVDDSSVTVLQYSFKLGWQIKRVNDTSHLRLL